MKISLNDGQREAIFSDASKIVCLAGAGTGKTYALIERISRLVSSGVDPNSILALTFTNAAAFEMLTRYDTLHPNSDHPMFKTFHGFCYDLLASNKSIRLHLGYTDVPDIADEFMQKEIYVKASLQVGSKLSRSKFEHPEKLSMSEQYSYKVLCKAISKLMKKHNLITFDTLSSVVCQLFTSNDTLIQGYKTRFKYIFVDEFQDTSPVEWSFIKSFEQSNLFVIGDAQQSIYGFRGADSSIIKSLVTDPEWTTIRLVENYRSTQPICEYANELTHRYVKDKSYVLNLQSSKLGWPVEIRRSSHDEKIYYGEVPSDIVASIIADLPDLFGSTAILCRTNKECSFVKAVLQSHNIPFNSKIALNDFEYIKKSVDDEAYMIQWIASLLPTDAYIEYIRRCSLTSEATPYTAARFLNEFGHISVVVEKISLITSIQKICETTSNYNDMVNELFKIFNQTPSVTAVSDDMSPKDVLNAVISKIAEVSDTSLYVGTIHSVKGLEFTNVYVLNVGSCNFRCDSEEDNNLYYVAVTRAKHRLCIHCERS